VAPGPQTGYINPMDLDFNASSTSTLESNLPYLPPYDWDSLAAFFAARVLPGVEQAGAQDYLRTIRIDGKTGLLEVRPLPGQNLLALRVSPQFAAGAAGLASIAGRVRRMFDLDANPDLIAHHLGQDARLAPLLAAYPGLRLPGAWDGFELAVRAVLGQQISVRAATSLSGKLTQAYGEPLGVPSAAGGPRLLFPRPEVLAEASLAELGMPASRRETIRRLASAVAGGRLDFSLSAGLDDFVAAFTQLPGIGPWTAHYVALRLGAGDAFPSGDLGVRRGASAPGTDLISQKNLLAQAEAWRPFRAYAVMYLWKSYSIKKED
jgi:3-methyladenine DNA glycosylase/8-oxoguanine DNA glycosylase